MAWGWAEVDEVLLRLLWVWMRCCSAAQVIVGLAQPAEALRCRPPLRSLYRIMGIAIVLLYCHHHCACHNLSVYPATKNKWQQGLVWLHLRVGFSCDTSFSTAYCYSLAISLFPHKYLIWASAIIPTQQQRSPRISKAISFPLKFHNLFPHHLQGSIEYTALNGDI